MTNNGRHPLRAGAAKVDITPQNLEGLTNLWGRPFEGVHDPIFLRALVVDNGVKSIAIVAADLVEFGDTLAIRRRIEREIGIPAGHIILTASHDHNAPRAGKVTPGATAQPGGPATEKYTEKVYDQIVDVVCQAKMALLPARLGVGSSKADVNTNRDVFTAQGWRLGTNPDGPSDKTLWVVKFETLTGEPIAILLNYAVHSVVLGDENRFVTGDLAGAAERYIEQCYADKVVALWTLGAAADQNPKYMGWDVDTDHRERFSGYTLADAQGAILGEEAIRAAGRIKSMASEVRIEAAHRIICCPARIPSRERMKVEQVDSMDLQLGLILLNQIAVTAVSGEVGTNIYRHLREVSPLANTLMITIANDRIGYIVDDAAYDTPTFEATATPLQRGYAETAIVGGLTEMMNLYL